MIRKVTTFLLYTISISILVFAFYNPYRRQKKLDADRRYTVGVVFKKTSSLKNGVHYHYKFSYMSHDYEGYNAKKRSQKIAFGERFIVEFSSEDPTLSNILFEYPVRSEINDAPDSGWKQIPIQRK
ncbi:hypothetical protein V9K67_09175 [Paraflavisolibacter sp. H34]|uniref:hypothetical protein n=1 Tax=Huijunlia imazamoxiresistens TaxID=3127457 RepID=UPI003016ED0E